MSGKAIIRKVVMVALAILLLYLGYTTGIDDASKNKKIGGTYVFGFVTLSIDEKNKVFYYSDARNMEFFTGEVNVLSEESCMMNSSRKTICRQIVSNLDGKLYVLIYDTPCLMKKTNDHVVIVNSKEYE